MVISTKRKKKEDYLRGKGKSLKVYGKVLMKLGAL